MFYNFGSPRFYDFLALHSWFFIRQILKALLEHFSEVADCNLLFVYNIKSGYILSKNMVMAVLCCCRLFKNLKNQLQKS